MEILSRVASTTPFNFIDARVKSESSDLNIQPDENQKVKVNLTMARKKSESRTAFVEGLYQIPLVLHQTTVLDIAITFNCLKWRRHI